ncbi:MAG TPA: Ig-like domain repeat protein [Terriglobales bacterium]|nr:Ig-like domain repeat protein [Terriglobales bacterium]
MRILLCCLVLAISAAAQGRRGAVDLGAAPGSLDLQRVLLLLHRTPRQSAALSKLLADQQSPGAPQYHQWLTPAAFGERFGASAEAQAQVGNWLTQRGFSNIQFRPGGSVVSFDGSAGAVGRAFATAVHGWQSSRGQRWASRTPAVVPPELLGVVEGVVALNNFPLTAGAVSGHGTGRLSQPDSPRPAFTFSDAQGQAQHALVPADFGVLFQMQPLWAAGTGGQGASIAIVARSNINLADVADFRRLFAPSDPANLPTVVLNGPDPGELHNGDEYEADLDSEWAGALAPAAKVIVVVSASTNATDGIILSAQYIVEHDLAAVMSLSYTACEAQFGATENQFWNHLFQQAAAEGITVVASSGDSGVAGCDADSAAQPAAAHGAGVNGLASSPFETAVGGTRLLDDGAAGAAAWSATNNPVSHGSVLQPVAETAWNDSCLNPGCDPSVPLSAGGGGDSALYPQPVWQQAPGTGAAGHRQIPDVAFAASPHDGYLVCAEASCRTVPGGLFGYFILGGTSAAAPAFAALMAMVDQQTAGRQGLANPTLYRLARQSLNPGACDASLGAALAADCVFADITSGNNSVPCVIGSPGCVSGADGVGILAGYTAAAGYDRATGLGAINAARLVGSWNSGDVRAATRTQLQLSRHQGTQVLVCVQGEGAGIPTGAAAVLQALRDGREQQLAAVALAAADGEACGEWSTPRLPGGTYALLARYGGDADFAASASGPLRVQSPPAATQSSLSAWLTGAGGPVPTQAAPYGAAIQFLAQVAAPAGLPPPTGTVQLQNQLLRPRRARGGNLPQAATLARWPLNSQGEAAAPASLFLPPGDYRLVASYSGDTAFAASQSAPYTLRIVRAATSVALVTAPTPRWMQLGATVVATGAAQAPGGDVEFFAGATPLGYSPLTPLAPAAGSGLMVSAAHYIVSSSSPADRYSAYYAGDSNFLPSAPFDLTSGAAEVTLTAGGSGEVPLQLAPVGRFQGAVHLTCTVVPAGPACAIHPDQFTLAGHALAAQLTLSAAPSQAGDWPGLWTALLAGLLLLAVILPSRPRCRPHRLVWLAAWGLLACSCGGLAASRHAPVAAGTYRVYLRAASASAASVQQLTLIVH